MGIKAGLVGLPNVGKSTLFNALTKSSIPAANYPFCTVDPNIAITNVPDERLDKLAHIFNSHKKIPTTIQFVDIAGLVKGAAEGEGLGNQFLGHILDVHLVLHVLRCFEDSEITHVHGAINPIDDFEAITTELMLKDLETVQKRINRLDAFLKSAKSKQASLQQVKEWETEKLFLQEVIEKLEEGNIEHVQACSKAFEEKGIASVPLLSAKKFLIIANFSEDDYAEKAYENNGHYKNLVKKFGKERVIPVSAKIESELAQMDQGDAEEMMTSLGLTTKGLDHIIQQSYSNLGLITFFTCGPKEAHAWSVKHSTLVPEAAGTIHSDLQRGFICAEVYNCQDLFDVGNEQKLKETGKIRTEGKDYLVHDGDVIVVRFNV